MAKRKSWFGWVKRLFTSESREKKPKKRGWSLGRLKQKHYPTIAAPNRTLIEATADQRKHALTVAIATAAAAEAAVAAAHAAAEVVKLTGASRSYSYLSKGERNLAAIRIQSAYRAHLARKALRALKGVIRLQAIVRGQAVRRQMSSSLKNYSSNARKQAEIQERSTHIAEESYKNDKTKQFPKQKKNLEEKELKLQPECHSQRTWDCSLHSREDIEAIWLRKQEAIVKRQRIKQYSFSHREKKIPQLVEESVHKNDFGRESCRTLGQWLHKETCDWNVLNKPALPSNLTTRELNVTTQVARKNLKKYLQEEGLSSQISIPRKSFSHVKRSSVGDESSMPNSPVFPTYMAVTESNKAKVRSASTPRQRTGFLDICSNQSEPHREGMSFCSSYCGATTSINENSEGSQQRCPRTNCYCYHQKM